MIFDLVYIALNLQVVHLELNNQQGTSLNLSLVMHPIYIAQVHWDTYQEGNLRNTACRTYSVKDGHHSEITKIDSDDARQYLN